ncbi:hypothetical protein [Acinetobacter chinensis]|nr:hypothetical protein [Acinetobacter chinensis]
MSITVNTKKLPSSLISKKVHRLNDLLEYIVILNGIGHSIQFLATKIDLTERNDISDSINVSINLMAGITIQYYKAFNHTDRKSINEKKSKYKTLLSKDKIFSKNKNILTIHNKIKKFRNETFSHMEDNYEMNLAFFNISDPNNIFMTYNLDNRRFISEFLTKDFLNDFYNCALHVRAECISEAKILVDNINKIIKDNPNLREAIIQLKSI